VPFKVLLIDDSRTMRQVLKVYLMGRKYDFVEADGATRALDVLRTTEIDLVIADVNMPKIDGIEFVKLVRASDLPRVATVPLILVTGDKSKEMQARMSDAKADAFLTKPLDADRLVQLVEEFLAKRSPPP
jgi:two-component system, chemotaxis family, chemotaxis protein CheY